MEKLVVVVHSVRMPVGFGRTALRTKGRQLANMANLKRSIIEVKAEICLTHALILRYREWIIIPTMNIIAKGIKYVL